MASSLQEEHLAVMFTSRLALPNAMTWTEKSTTCVANLPRSRKHARALPAAVDMTLLYYCGWLWCCYNYCCLAWSSLVTCNEKTKKTDEKDDKKENEDET